MKVGVLGSGDVAKALAEGFIKHGHPTMIGTRDPAKLAEWRQDNRKTKVGSFSETAAFGEVLALAVKGSVAADVLRLAGSANLDGKLVMDACNPIADAPPVNGVLKFFTTLDDSLMERLQRAFPKAHFVKAFSSVGHGQFVNPQYKAGKPTMFICGNDDGAKVVTAQILEQFGWETADMGKVESARAIEPLCMLWCVLGFTKNEWTHAFKLLHQ
ncbi:MAG: NAD(P)-binding domain-containing protein [Terracidiphilus sp.]|jgi:predicted dinucleotide-binding enzyme